MNEETVLIIQTTETKALCFTTNRVIVAEVGAPGDVLTASYAPFASLLQDLRRGKKMRQLRNLSPEGILTANKKNFAVFYAGIGKVELFGRRLSRKIRITAGAATYEFLLAKPKEVQNYANILRPVLANKLAVDHGAQPPPRHPARSDLQVDLFKTVLKTLGAAIFIWLILNGAAGHGDPVVVGILAFCGAGIGAGIGFGWASKVSGWRRLGTFLVMASLGAAVWASVPLGFLGAVSATGIVAVLLMLSWLRFSGRFRWPW